jgi:hypothetical protein
LRRDIAARPTNVIDSIASLILSERSVATAAFWTSARDTLSLRTLEEMSIARPRG